MRSPNTKRNHERRPLPQAPVSAFPRKLPRQSTTVAKTSQHSGSRDRQQLRQERVRQPRLERLVCPPLLLDGDNPINFVSVEDVAALLEHVVTDVSARGSAYEIGGPENLTFNQLAAAVQASAGRTSPPRHLPRAMLRVLGTALRPVKPDVARQARAAFVMDTADLTFEATSMRLGRRTSVGQDADPHVRLSVKSRSCYCA